MIELVSAERCIGCDKCVEVCPTRVFDRGANGIPVLTRQTDCQTCFLCEAYCPTDALFVAARTEPLAPDDEQRDEQYLIDHGLLGSYRKALGWGGGPLGARYAIGPELP
ncbi:NAD-dependent dihydropyrimidine dehydrogenase PreA subunit [Nocardia tenerifensis]|uniref:NAD-dependent dihydropyrimidine dehydrogenase PreA subunit n=1 Tax=Nocardia tenerifensis TaxID=228006 RepID=A0A318K1J5_9NOCA|nr:ferredoxin family protein [Nocardia tenerifensis]PXX64287.1 NAD-dependent dihydropyrimidine dehydrogenase PreA subunit [Nocardia tenerifensis]